MTRWLGSAPTPLVASALGAAVLGVLAVVTGAPAVAAVSGLASLLCAGSAVRAVRNGRPLPPSEWRDRDARAVSSTDVPAADAGVTDVGAAGTGAAERAPVPPPAGSQEETPRADSVTTSPLSGLLTGEFLEATLRHRVAVARRALRPLSLLQFEVLELGDAEGKRPVPPAAVFAMLRRTLREADSAAVVDGSSYLCILEDTGEDGAVWAAERIRRNLAEEDPGRRFRAGVASYPNHALDADELRRKVGMALDGARQWSRDRIEVATGS